MRQLKKENSFKVLNQDQMKKVKGGGDGEGEKASWVQKGSLPVKYTPPSNDPEADTEPAVEEIEIAYESFTMEWI